MSGEPDSIAALRLKVQNGEVANPRTIDFAWSLIRQFEKKGSLSEKQMEWVEKIINATPGGSHESLDIIKANLDQISKREIEFVQSLIEQWDTKGFFSAKQDWWVSKICRGLNYEGELTQGLFDAEVEVSNPPQTPSIVQRNSDAHVVVELRPQVWAVIDTTSNTILGTFDSETDALQATNR